mgnify:CR=1 FL=1
MNSFSIKHLLVTAILCLSSFVNAQSSKLTIGLETGPTISFLRGNDLMKETGFPLLDYSAGVNTCYSFTRFFGLQSGLLFENKGNTFKGTAVDVGSGYLGVYKGKNRFSYLTLPFMFKLQMGDQLKFYVNAGPYLAYLMQVQYQSEFNNLKVINNDRSNYHYFDWGLSLGCGTSVKVANRYRINLECRNQYGLRNISNGPVYNNGTVMTNALSVLLGFGMDL